VDGLFGNFGVTWARRFRGYTQEQLNTLPRVTTETGTNIEGPVTEEIHGLNLMNLYLAQFKRGYAHTSVYLLRDRTDEDGNQSFGFYQANYSPARLNASQSRLASPFIPPHVRPPHVWMALDMQEFFT
jgi:hypothetical protein